jgi:hypothetical protein
MKEAVDYRKLATDLGLCDNDISNVIKAADTSWQKLVSARTVLAAVDQTPLLAVFACGSLGRLEVGDASDLDLALIFDSKQAGDGVALSSIDTGIGAIKTSLRSLGFDISEKGLFCERIDLNDLLDHIGGDEENSRHLTYRALLLTEGHWLYNSATASEFKNRLFGAYRDGAQTRGKFLTSLSNDLHRYYRTLCVDYRWKVESTEKPWAIRNLKLRHSRKLWHFANVMLQCASALEPDESRDKLLESSLGVPPLARIALIAQRVNRTHPHVPPTALCQIYRAYDYFLGQISREEVRTELDGLEHATRDGNPTFRALRENAQTLANAIEQVVEGLWQNSQMREHMVRFCLL